MNNDTLNYYNKNAAQLVTKYEQTEVAQLHATLRKTFEGSSTLLEIGCGSGREASYLVRNGFDVRCIDGSPKMAAEAVRIHPELEGRIDVSILPEQFPLTNTYNGIYCIAVLMHFPEQIVTEILGKIYTILERGGRFLFSVPLTRPGLTKSGVDSSGRHFLLLSGKAWQRLTTSAGLHILDTETTSDGMSRPEVTWFTCIAEKPA